MPKLREFDLAPNEGIIMECPKGKISIQVLDFDEASGAVMLAIDADFDVKIELPGERDRELWGTPNCQGLPRLWLLFSLLLTKDTRRRIFLPVFNEFVEDYLAVRSFRKKKWEKRWLAFVYTTKTFGMVGRCLGLQMLESCDEIQHRIRGLLKLVVFAHAVAAVIKFLKR